MISRIRSRLPILAILTLIGCGTLSVDIATTVDSESRFTHSIELSATGLMAELIQLTVDVEELRADGWVATLDRDGDAVRITLDREFTGDDATRNSSENPTGLAFPFNAFVINVDKVEGETQYRVSLIVERDTDPLQLEFLPQYRFDRLRDVVVEERSGSFKLDWKLKVPGEVGDTNADSVDGGIARWQVDLSDLEMPLTLFATSVEKRGGGGACSRPR